VSPESYVKSVYFAFFQSIIKYGLLIWGNSCKIKEVLILQKKAVRLMAGAEPLEHCKPLFTKLGLQTIINLYIFECTSYAINNLKFALFGSDFHDYNTRNKSKISIEYCRLTKSQQSHIITSQQIYNKLIHLSDKYSVKDFLSKFYSWLLQNPFYSLTEFFNMATADICF